MICFSSGSPPCLNNVPCAKKKTLVRPQADCRSAIRMLQDAENKAADIVLAATERAQALRQKGAAESEAEGQRLRTAMKAFLAAIASKV